MQSKYKLPNGNVFLWLGPGTGVEKNLGIENVLVLEGGEVLLFKSAITIPLYKQEVISDFRNEDPSDLAWKYGIPISRGLIEDLKNGVANGTYPPFKQSINERFTIFKDMISKYIQRFQSLHSKEDAIRHIEDVIDMCHQEINRMRNKP